MWSVGYKSNLIKTNFTDDELEADDEDFDDDDDIDDFDDDSDDAPSPEEEEILSELVKTSRLKFEIDVFCVLILSTILLFSSILESPWWTFAKP